MKNPEGRARHVMKYHGSRLAVIKDSKLIEVSLEFHLYGKGQSNLEKKECKLNARIVCWVKVDILRMFGRYLGTSPKDKRGMFNGGFNTTCYDKTDQNFP